MRKGTLAALIGLLAVVGLGAASCMSPQLQLVGRNLTGQGFPTPPAQALAGDAVSRGADLSVLNVSFDGADADALPRLVPDVFTRLDVEDGWLKMAGRPVIGGWYSDRSGPMVYREVSGDFMVETTVRSVRVGAPDQRPTGDFNSAGLLVRDSSSAPGAMRWAMFNIGMQEEFFGTEIKMTVPDFGGPNQHGVAGFRSRSTLWLTPVADTVREAQLRLCRIGNEVRFFHRFDGASGWSELVRTSETTVQGNGLAQATPGVPDAPGPMRFTETGLPETVQVGLVVNPGMPPSDGEGWFRNIRFQRISDFSACAL